MATLNYNWQQLGSATLYSGITICIDGKLVSQSTENNTSSMQFRFRSSGSYWRTSNGTATFNGWATDSGGCATYPNYIYDGDTIFQISKTVGHDNNGDCYFWLGGVLTAIINGGTRTADITQFRVDLPHINRYATITKANDFTDEGNPSFTFNNVGGFRINARLEFNGTSIRRDNISNTGSYTFSLTSSERNTLRQNCTGKTMTVTYVLATCYSGTTESHTESTNKTMSIVNGNPTFSVTYQDSNSTTTAITNNNQQIIQNKSTLQFNIANATALKYATLSNVKITINGASQTKTISGSSLSFNYGTINVSSNTNASVVLTDSRGFTKTISVPITVLSWSSPTAIITLNRKSNYYTETDIKVDANYSSLSSHNTITIKYRIKKKTTSTWGSYTNLSDNVTATFNADNTYEWDVQVVVNDRLASQTYNLSLGLGVPIMFIDRRKRNVGVDCFPQSTNALEVQGTTQTNGDLLIADSNGANAVNVATELTNAKATISSGTNKRSIKYGNGLLINTMKITKSNISVSTAWGNIYASGNQSIGTYQTAFTELYSVNITCYPQLRSGETYNFWYMLTASDESLTAPPNVQFLRGTSGTVSAIIYVTAIGKWK